MPPFIGCSAYDNLRSPAFFALMNIFPYFFLLYHLFLLILQLQRVVGSEDVSSPTCVLGAQYGGIALCSLLFIILNDVYRLPFDTCFNIRFYIFLFQILCLD